MTSQTLPNDNASLVTKQLILAESVKLFARRGFNGVSMRDIAKAVGITPGALYYYFPNKKELHVAAVAYAYRERSAPAVDALSEAHSGDPMLVLEQFIQRLCTRFYDDNDFRRLVQWILLDCETDKDLRDIIIKVVYEKHYDSLYRFLATHVPGANAYRLTVFIFGIVLQNYATRGIRQFWSNHYDEQEEEPANVTREIMALLKSGMFRAG